MKIAIAGYNTCCLNRTGGVHERIKKIYNLLKQRDNVEVSYFSPLETNMEDVDILHLFKLEPEYYNLVLKAKQNKIRVVLSSVVPIERGWLISLYTHFINKLPILTIYKMNKIILEMVDYIVTESETESCFIVKHYNINKDKIRVIPNGIDITTYKGNEIYEYIGGEKEFVLQVGLIHENKNQLNTIKSLKDSGIDVVFIGGVNNKDTKYYDLCKEAVAGDEHFHFLGWVNHDNPLLKSAYSHAKAFVFPSYHETFGLVVLEAAIADCNIAMTRTLPIHDYHVFDGCWMFDPADVNDMKEKILEAFHSPYNREVKDRVIKTFSWSKVIDEYMSLYESINK